MSEATATSPTPGVPPQWSAYRAERNRLLERLVEALERDPTAAAAWLIGSLGRGDADDLSDIDIWIVVEDEALEGRLQNPGETAYGLSPVLFTVEAPQNAPPGGAYLMTCSDSPTAPHLIDWYWQPASRAVRPADSRLLFQRRNLAVIQDSTNGGQCAAPERTAREAAGLASRFFWAMLMISAKHGARRPREQTLPLLPYVLGPLEEVMRFTGAEPPLHMEEEQATPSGKLRALRQLREAMQALHPRLEAAGAPAPTATPEAVGRYLDLIAPAFGEPKVVLSEADAAIVAPYSPDWPVAFDRIAEALRQVLGPLASAIHHVGSTSVPGLPAKPILDVDVEIASESSLPEIQAQLAAVGYRYEGEKGIAQRHAFAAEDDSVPHTAEKRRWMAHHLYICPSGSPELTRHLRLRDRLRGSAILRAEYIAIKRAALDEARGDRRRYVEAKAKLGAAFFSRVLAEEEEPDQLT